MVAYLRSKKRRLVLAKRFDKSRHGRSMFLESTNVRYASAQLVVFCCSLNGREATKNQCATKHAIAVHREPPSFVFRA